MDRRAKQVIEQINSDHKKEDKEGLIYYRKSQNLNINNLKYLLTYDRQIDGPSMMLGGCSLVKDVLNNLDSS